MRLSRSAYRAHPWRIAEIAPDFELLDAWALPVEGSREDFDAFLAVMDSLDPTRSPSAATRALFWLRFRLGALFGWDDAAAKRPVPGCRETTLRARLPADLRGGAEGPAARGANGTARRFAPLYRTEDEWAAEISNDTVHGVLHLVWVERGEGCYRAQMGVYVKPRGRLGEVYLKLIGPFRHRVVYPALLRQIGRAWEARGGAATAALRATRAGRR
jgi:hypothetical protein